MKLISVEAGSTESMKEADDGQPQESVYVQSTSNALYAEETTQVTTGTEWRERVEYSYFAPFYAHLL